MQYVRLDLNYVKETLGGHYNRSLRDEYTGVCEVCQEDVPQTVNECPVCGTAVVWYNSPVWKSLFGSPDAFVRLLNVVEPEDGAGLELCRRASVSGFANQTEAQRWKRAYNKLGHSRMMGIVEYVTKKGNRGRGVIAHALNTAEKIAREQKITKPQEGPKATVPEGAYDTDNLLF